MLFLVFLVLFLSFVSISANSTTTTTILTTTTIQSTTTTVTTTTIPATTTSVTTTTSPSTTTIITTTSVSITTTIPSTTTTLPDFQVGIFTWEPINPYPGQNFIVFSDITKTGESDQNITVQWNISETTVCNENISADSFVNSIKRVNCNFLGFPGQKNISLKIDSENSVAEASEDNNFYSKILSTDLNITILNYNGIQYNSSDIPSINHNNMLNFSILVNYWTNNNTNITDLDASSFNLYDKWGSRNPIDVANKISMEFTKSSSGIYLINYTVPEISNDILEYGEHEITIQVNKSIYHGEYQPLKYSMNGPNLAISFDGINDFDLDNTDNVNFNVSATNNGNQTVYGVNLTSIINTSPGTLSGTSGCDSVNKQVDSSQKVVLCSVTFKSSESGESKITALVKGSYDNKTIKYEKNATITVDPKKTSSTPEDSDIDQKDIEDSFGSSSPKTAAAKTSDYLKIDSFPEKVELQQGERKTVTVNVNNVDDFEFQDVALKVTGIDSSWITVIPAEAAEIEPLKSQEYRVVFEIPEDSEIKDYDGVFEASSSLKTQKQPFVLSVLPGPELQAAINQTVQDYQNQIQQLENEISGKKSKGYNTTEAEQKLQELKDEFNKVLSYKDEGNYKSVYGMLNNTGSLLNQTSSLLSGAFALSAQPLAGIAGSEGILFGLLALLLGAGTYTFWGRHFKIKERIAGKVMAKKNEKPWSRDLDIILKKAVNGQKAAEDKPRTEEVKPQVSERMRELNAIKSLAVKGK